MPRKDYQGYVVTYFMFPSRRCPFSRFLFESLYLTDQGLLYGIFSEVFWPLPPKAGTQDGSAPIMCMFWQLVTQGYFPREVVKLKEKCVKSTTKRHGGARGIGEGRRGRGREEER